ARKGRKYCSQRCYKRALGRRTHQCPACGKQFTAPAAHQRQFCSHRCANSRRLNTRTDYTDRQERNARILKLHATGTMTAAQIAAQLAEETDDRWLIDQTTVRVVVYRARATGLKMK